MLLIMGNVYQSAFSDGEYCFEILTTDRSSRNLLIPAVRPSSGFSARELKKVCGQGALYLRLVESSPSDHEVLFPIYLYIYISSNFLQAYQIGLLVKNESNTDQVHFVECRRK